MGLAEEENTTTINGRHVQLNAQNQGGGQKPPRMRDHSAVKLHRRTRAGRLWKRGGATRGSVGDRDETVGTRPGQDAAQHCDTTASLKTWDGRNPAETQEKWAESETESRGRVPSKCQDPNKSALMEEVCLEESTECSPAKCTWLALHTQTRTHVLMTGRRPSRARPSAWSAPRATCNVMKSNSTVRLRKTKWWSIHDERTPDTRPTYWDWSVYSRLDTHITVCRLFVNVCPRPPMLESAFPSGRNEEGARGTPRLQLKKIWRYIFPPSIGLSLWSRLIAGGFPAEVDFSHCNCFHVITSRWFLWSEKSDRVCFHLALARIWHHHLRSESDPPSPRM